MNNFMVAMQFASLFGKLMETPEGKELIDKILDPIEVDAKPGGRTEAMCVTIRLMLKVPDND